MKKVIAVGQIKSRGTLDMRIDWSGRDYPVMGFLRESDDVLRKQRIEQEIADKE